MQDFPKVILWAWERPENLSFIDPQKIGIAFLAKTVYLRKDNFSIKPRLQPLTMPDNAICIAVIRMESDGFDPKLLPDKQLEKVISSIIGLCKLPFVHAIQIDFDAKVSERDFYREFLLSLREKMPPNMPLSITALASWCIYDSWLSGLPLDEAVPMLFRMGIDRGQIILYLKSGKDFIPPICKHSIGLSMDEPFIGKHLDRRLYIFNPKSWSKEALSGLLEEIGK